MVVCNGRKARMKAGARDQAELQASKAFIAKRDSSHSKLNTKRFAGIATEAQDQRRKAMQGAIARRQAQALAGGRAITGAATHDYDMTPRHVIQHDRPLSNQKPRKVLSDEQMRKRREQIAARLSRKVDPAKLHAFAEAKETDVVHIGRGHGGTASKAKAKTKRSRSLAKIRADAQAALASTSPTVHVAV